VAGKFEYSNELFGHPLPGAKAPDLGTSTVNPIDRRLLLVTETLFLG
jgi:hypothetical protein